MEAWEAISPYLSGIVLLGGAIAVIWKWIAPAFKITKTVKENTERIKKVEEHQANDLNSLKEMESSMKLQNKAMLQVINHFIDGGNNIAGLKAAREELTELLMK